MAEKLDLTIRAIEALSIPTSGRAEYKDAKTAGLYLRVTPNGVKTFSFVGRAKGSGRVERVTLGKYPAVKPEEAKRQAKILNGELAGGTSPSEALRGKRKEQTLSHVAGLYFESLKLRGATSKAYASVWKHHIQPAFGSRKLSDITAIELERWHRGLPAKIQGRQAEERAAREAAQAERRARIDKQNAVRRRGPDPKPRTQVPSKMARTGQTTANRALQCLRAIYRWAADPRHGYFSGTSPASGHEMFSENERERFLRPDELAPFFNALSEEPNATMRDFILVALLTGARRSNVAAMQWADVDLARAEWRVAGQFMKNGDPQTITLTPEAVTILQARKEVSASPHVFPSDRAKCGHIRDPKSTWRRLLLASGLSDLRLHDLRRTLGSWQARTGASLVLIGKSLNHRDQASTAIYARLDLDPIRQSVARATSAMFEAAGLKAGVSVLPLRASAEPANAEERTFTNTK